jgi:hypothetical protein
VDVDVITTTIITQVIVTTIVADVSKVWVTTLQLSSAKALQSGMKAKTT